MREKWDSPRGGSTWGEDTISKAFCTETYSGDNGHANQDSFTTLKQEEPYEFASVVPPDHFISKWIDYASSRTDAAHEYHEAAALTLLATATPDLRAWLTPYTGGLGTNLYMLLIGDSTTSRKSTVKDFAQDAQARALPGSQAPDQASPEGFVEHLASRPHDSTTLYVDEFGGLLEKLHHAKHMAQMAELLLTVYGGNDYLYKRHSKSKKSGERVEDSDRITAPHLSILGATTPAIFEKLAENDVTSGLLPRFAIVMPSRKPKRMKIGQVSNDTAKLDVLVRQLDKLHDWIEEADRTVVFDPEATDVLDEFVERLEQTIASETGKRMLTRLPAMTYKVAMLVAAGKGTPAGTLEVTLADAEAAIKIVDRWARDALLFAERIGENEFERKLQVCLRLVKARKKVRRSVVAQNCHMDKKTLDMVQATLVDRDEIRVIQTPPRTPGGSILVEWEASSK